MPSASRIASRKSPCSQAMRSLAGRAGGSFALFLLLHAVRRAAPRRGNYQQRHRRRRLEQPRHLARQERAGPDDDAVIQKGDVVDFDRDDSGKMTCQKLFIDPRGGFRLKPGVGKATCCLANGIEARRPHPDRRHQIRQRYARTPHGRRRQHEADDQAPQRIFPDRARPGRPRRRQAQRAPDLAQDRSEDGDRVQRAGTQGGRDARPAACRHREHRHPRRRHRQHRGRAATNG